MRAPAVPSLEAIEPRPREAALVGGAVRDLALGLTPRDFDWRVADPGAAAEAFAARMGGRSLPLDRTRGHWRVLLPDGTRHDFVPADRPLEEDLARRDLTINALALEADGLVDPAGGLADLRAGRVRQVAPGAFEADPVRVLRAVRLAAALRFGWDAATRERAREVTVALRRGALPAPANERVGEELRDCLCGPAPASAVRDLIELGWTALIFGGVFAAEAPERVARLLSVRPDADEALRWAALSAPAEAAAVRSWGAAADTSGRTLRSLRRPNAVVRRTSALLRAAARPVPRGEREQRRYLHRTRVLQPDVLDLRHAAAAEEARRERLRSLRARVAAHLETPEPDPLLNGREVMEALGLGPGPRVGEALAYLAEAQALGDVTNRTQAVAALRRRFGRRRAGPSRGWALLAFAPSLVLGAIGAAVLAWRPLPYAPTVGWGPSLAAGVGVGAILLAASALLERWLPSFRRASKTMERALKSLPLSRAAVLALATTAAVGEELAFRGVLLPWVGLVPQALAFGLLHPAGRRAWSYPVFAAVAGLAFGGLVLTTGRLLPAIVAHVLVNALGALGDGRQARSARNRRSMP